MARTDPGLSWRLEAVTVEGRAELSEGAASGFHEASVLLGRPGLFEAGAIVIENQAFTELTGFHLQSGELIDRGVVRRAAEAATAGRTKALTNCNGALGGDYVSLGVFLRVCAAQGLGLTVTRHMARRRGA